MHISRMLRKYLFRRDLGPGSHRYLRRLLWRHAFCDQKRLLANQKVETIFDLGANHGLISLKYHDLFSSAKIHMFEPFPSTYQRLGARFSGLEFAVPHQLAISDRSGADTLYLTASDYSHSLFEPLLHKEGANSDVRPVIQVQTETLDNFCVTHGIEHINILKMDIQGSECKALAGAEKLLSQQAIDLIYTEFFVLPKYEHQALWHNISSQLAHHDYVLFNLYNFSESNVGQLYSGDAIYLSKRLRERLYQHHGAYNTQYESHLL